MSIYYKNYSNNPDPVNPPAIGTGYSDAKLSAYRPNVRLQFQDPATRPLALVNPGSGDYGFNRTWFYFRTLNGENISI